MLQSLTFIKCVNTHTLKLGHRALAEQFESEQVSAAEY